MSLPLPELDELDELLEELLLEEEELLLDELEEDELLLLEEELLELLEEEELLEDIRSASAPFSASTWARPQSSPNSASISALIWASSSAETCALSLLELELEDELFELFDDELDEDFELDEDEELFLLFFDFFDEEEELEEELLLLDEDLLEELEDELVLEDPT